VPANSKLKIGDKVMVDPRLYCRNCTRCKASKTHACYSWGFRGLQGGGGGLSELVAVDESMCYVLPEVVDLKITALIEPLAVAMHAVKNSGVQELDFAEKDVLILGGGPIGLAVITVLRMKDVRRVFVSEPTAKRQVLNEEVADKVFDPVKERVGDRCRELTGGEGVNVVFDCAGIISALKDGMDALCHGGIYVNVAAWVAPVSTSPFLDPKFASWLPHGGQANVKITLS
jgi:threonine dehydrogenase-like Zn-dependent dehydrogenase